MLLKKILKKYCTENKVKFLFLEKNVGQCVCQNQALWLVDWKPHDQIAQHMIGARTVFLLERKCKAQEKREILVEVFIFPLILVVFGTIVFTKFRISLSTSKWKIRFEQKVKELDNLRKFSSGDFSWEEINKDGHLCFVFQKENFL